MLPEYQIKSLYEELGKRIREARVEMGFKQVEFASLLKISRASLVNIEQGRQHPPIHNLYEIARLLRRDIKDLLPVISEPEEGVVGVELEREIEEMSDGNLEVKQKLLLFVRSQS